jgi:hypothetical protein
LPFWWAFEGTFGDDIVGLNGNLGVSSTGSFDRRTGKGGRDEGS